MSGRRLQCHVIVVCIFVPKEKNGFLQTDRSFVDNILFVLQPGTTEQATLLKIRVPLFNINTSFEKFTW